jgi:hypothetical protein
MCFHQSRNSTKPSEEEAEGLWRLDLSSEFLKRHVLSSQYLLTRKRK